MYNVSRASTTCGGHSPYKGGKDKPSWRQKKINGIINIWELHFTVEMKINCTEELFII